LCLEVLEFLRLQQRLLRPEPNSSFMNTEEESHLINQEDQGVLGVLPQEDLQNKPE